MTQIRHNLKVGKLEKSSGGSLRANEHPVPNTTEATEWKRQNGLHVIVSAIKGSNGGKPEDSQVLSRATLQVHLRC